MGKMKFGVSLLQNSFSKWLSPKVEGIGRRRRHEEMDSDDESINRNISPVVATGSTYQTTPQLAAPPPNKKKKTFTVRK